MEKTRRGFLRLLGLGAAAPVASVLPTASDAGEWRVAVNGDGEVLGVLGPNPSLIGRTRHTDPYIQARVARYLKMLGSTNS